MFNYRVHMASGQYVCVSASTIFEAAVAALGAPCLRSRRITNIENTSDYRTLCEAAGWREYLNSPIVERISGEPHGIAHSDTIEGRDHHNDSIYGDWRTCWLEAVSPWPPDQRQAITEGWCIMWSDSRARWLIQRDDASGIFLCDEAARDHVEDQAKLHASAYHRDILAMLHMVND